MKTLTANNQRVQFFITYGESCSKQAKEHRLTRLEESLRERGQFVDEVFPMKQAAMLDKILYDTSGNGICKIGAETLAEYAGASTRTVTTFNKALKETGQFVIARLRNSKTNCGKLIYVDKLHANFKEIMREVFLLNANQIAELIAEQKQAENVDVSSLNDNNRSSNLDISFIKQEKDNYISDIDSSEISAIKEEIESEQQPSIEYVRQYTTNTRQIAFYELLEAMPYPEKVKSVRHILALRIGSDCDDKRFFEAKDSIHSIAMQIIDGVEIENVVAAFTGLLNKRMSYNVPKPQPVPSSSERLVPFYNWLEIRE